MNFHIGSEDRDANVGSQPYNSVLYLTWTSLDYLPSMRQPPRSMTPTAPLNYHRTPHDPFPKIYLSGASEAIPPAARLTFRMFLLIGLWDFIFAYHPSRAILHTHDILLVLSHQHLRICTLFVNIMPLFASLLSSFLSFPKSLVLRILCSGIMDYQWTQIITLSSSRASAFHLKLDGLPDL